MGEGGEAVAEGVEGAVEDVHYDCGCGYGDVQVEGLKVFYSRLVGSVG